MDKNDQPNAIGPRMWKDAFKDKAIYLKAITGSETTKGYRVIWYLWSADIWLGRFPLLKFILAVNIIVWVLQFIL